MQRTAHRLAMPAGQPARTAGCTNRADCGLNGATDQSPLPSQLMQRKRPMADDPVGDSGPSIDDRHLLLVGAGPGLGLAIARRFGVGSYAVTLVAPTRTASTSLPKTWLTPAPKSTRSERMPAIPKTCVTV